MAEATHGTANGGVTRNVWNGRGESRQQMIGKHVEWHRRLQASQTGGKDGMVGVTPGIANSGETHGMAEATPGSANGGETR